MAYHQSQQHISINNAHIVNNNAPYQAGYNSISNNTKLKYSILN